MEKGEVKLAMTTEEARHHLRLGRNSILRLLYSGRLRAVKVGTRWIIPRRAVEEFLAGSAEGEK